MKKGDIFFGRKNSGAVHPIVFLRNCDKNFFIGAMLTTSSNYTDNILMAEAHFKNQSLNDKKYELRFDDTYLVKREFFKKAEWGPFRKVGELTNEGIKFVESNTCDTTIMHFDDYRNTKKSPKKYGDTFWLRGNSLPHLSCPYIRPY